MFLARQMGYGARALQALNSFYSGEYFNLDEATNAEESFPDPSIVDEVRAHMSIFLPCSVTNVNFLM